MEAAVSVQITSANVSNSDLTSLKDYINQIGNSTFESVSSDAIAKPATIEDSLAEETANIAAAVDTKIASAATESEKKRMRRFLVTQEILETEKGYLADFNNIVRNFMDPLNSAYLAGVAASVSKGENATAATIVQNTTFGNEGGSNAWITFDQKQAIVRNSGHLLRFQKLFAKMIEEAVRIPLGATSADPNLPATEPMCSDPSMSQIARCFISMMPKIEAVYLPYCSQHDTAVETWALIRRTHSNQSQAFLDEVKSKMTSKLDIQDFLIKPVQRICKYPLLLNELLKGTPEDIPDRAELSEALDKIKALVGNVNEKKKVAENTRKKIALLSRLHPGAAHGIFTLCAAFEIEVELEAKAVPLNPVGVGGPNVSDKLGMLMRGGGLQVSDIGDHELPFGSAPPSTAAEVQYHGGFLFPEMLLILSAKKQSSYPILHVIPTPSVVLVQELSSDLVNHPALAHSFRVTWEVKERFGSFHYHTIDLGAKTRKEKEAWLTELEKLLSTKVSLVTGHATSESTVDSANAASNRSNTVAKKDSAGSTAVLESTTQEESNNAMALTDIKFADCYTSESLLIGAKAGQAASAKNSVKASASTLTAAVQGAPANSSASAVKGLFRKNSRSSNNSSTDSANKPGLVRRLSNASTRPLSIFGGGADNQDAASVDTSKNDAPESVAGSVLKLFRTKSMLRADAEAGKKDPPVKKSLSKQSLSQGDDDEEKSKRWGSTIKGKIMAVGKFSAAGKKGVDTSQQDLGDAEHSLSSDKLSVSDKQSNSKASNHSLAPSVAESHSDKPKKTNLFGKLVRSFSRSGEKDAKTSAMELPHDPTPLPPKVTVPEPIVAEVKALTIQDTIQPAPPKSAATSEGGSNLARRSGVRVKTTKHEADATADESAKGTDQTQLESPSTESEYTFKPAPPSNGVAAPPPGAKTSIGSARIAAIRAKRASKRDSNVMPDLLTQADIQQAGGETAQPIAN